MAYTKAYSKIVWKNDPSTDTPLNASNLNQMSTALDEIDNRVLQLQNSAYVYIRYSNYPEPTNLQMQTTPADYMGICVTSESTAPTNASSYTWQKVVGEDGDYVEMRATETYIQYKLSSSSTWNNLIALSAITGANGQSAYVWIKWGTSATPATLLDTPAEYIGIYSGTSTTPPTSYSSYNWYKYKGEKGDTGQGFKVLGYYNTLTMLQQSVVNPSTGDAYGIGESAPYDIYIYDGSSSSWVNNGKLQGATGQSAYVWIKYSENSPTADSDMVDTPSNWMGIYSGTATAAPTAYTSYSWYKIKGADGAQGAIGPNQVSTTTDTNIEGIIKGDANKVAQAVADTDYTSPATFNSHKNDTEIHVTSKEKEKWSAKQDALTAGNNITIENNVISSEGGGAGTFFAVYGTTTSAEIEEAYQAGKNICCIYNSYVIPLVLRGSSTSHQFVTPVVSWGSGINDRNPSTGFTISCSCNNDNWLLEEQYLIGYGALNRTNAVNIANTGYTTLMARGEKLLDATTFDAVTDWGAELVNGAIAWRYE